jgi:hypothetical protein
MKALSASSSGAISSSNPPPAAAAAPPPSSISSSSPPPAARALRCSRPGRRAPAPSSSLPSLPPPRRERGLPLSPLSSFRFFFLPAPPLPPSWVGLGAVGKGGRPSERKGGQRGGGPHLPSATPDGKRGRGRGRGPAPHARCGPIPYPDSNQCASVARKIAAGQRRGVITNAACARYAARQHTDARPTAHLIVPLRLLMAPSEFLHSLTPVLRLVGTGSNRGGGLQRQPAILLALFVPKQVLQTLPAIIIKLRLIT